MPPKKLLLSTALLAVMVVAGCDSSKDASKSNFASAIDKKLDEKCIAFRPVGMFSSGKYPIAIEDVVANQFMSEDVASQRNAQAQGPLNALVEAGVLSVKQETVKQDFSNRMVPAHVYDLTEKGKSSQMSPEGVTLCIGNYKVDEVTDFTEPGNANGTTISRAEYTYSPDKVPEWVKSPDVQKAYPQLQKRLADKQKGRALLVLKHDGWSAEGVGGTGF